MNCAVEAVSSWRWHFTSGLQATAPSLFLDRDGTLIENVPYLRDPDKVVLFPGVREMLARFRERGFRAVVVTNQSGIARGLCNRAEYEAVQARFMHLLGPGLVDAIYACPFHPEGNGEFAFSHAWRKPAPGMLLAAAQELNLNLAESVMVGDSLVDVEAGLAGGVKKVVHVLTGHGKCERTGISERYNDRIRACDIELLDSIAELCP